jgi:2-iminobutanoate/2-iminopropanoate deaminase
MTLSTLLLAAALGLPAPATALQAPAAQPVVRPAVTAGNLVYLAGMLPTDATGTVVAGDVRTQTARVLDNLSALLAQNGSRLEQVAAVTVYLRRQADFAAMNEVYGKYWPTDPPTRTTVIVGLAAPGALVEISMVALRTGAERRVVHPASWLRSPNPYSYAIQSGDTLFLSGLVSRNGTDNTAVPGDMTTQTATVLRNAAEILGAAGMTMADVVSSRVFITDTALFPDMNAVYRTAFGASPPARATVRAGLTASQHLVEITMLAVKGARREVFTTPGPDGSPGTPSPLLSSAVRADTRLYLSGMLGTTAATTGNAGTQTREALARLGRTLKAAGFDWSDVVDAVVYLPSLGDVGAVDAAYREVFVTEFPARATVEAGLVSADALVEIMMTAVRRR